MDGGRGQELSRFRKFISASVASGKGAQDRQAPPQTHHLSGWNYVGEVCTPQLNVNKEFSPYSI